MKIEEKETFLEGMFLNHWLTLVRDKQYTDHDHKWFEVWAGRYYQYNPSAVEGILRYTMKHREHFGNNISRSHQEFHKAMPEFNLLLSDDPLWCIDDLLASEELFAEWVELRALSETIPGTLSPPYKRGRT